MRRAAPWLLWWTGAFCFYLLLVWKISLAEVLVGGAAAALAAGVAEAARRAGMAHLSVDVRWPARARRLPRGVVADTILLGVTLWRHLTGRRTGPGEFRVASLASGSDDARSAARRALLVAGLTVTPNTIVVAFDADEDHMLPSCARCTAATSATTSRGSCWGLLCSGVSSPGRSAEPQADAR
ncbi:hypothetical protein BH18ACT15_BH18ACT15_04770 [soil metagenome]